MGRFTEGLKCNFYQDFPVKFTGLPPRQLDFELPFEGNSLLVFVSILK